MKRSRRSFCELVGSSLLATSVPARATASSTSPTLGTVNWQLGWLETVQFAGSYIADTRGYYRAQGIDVAIMPGGPNVAVAPLLVAGKALIGDGSISTVAQARANGAPLKIVAARWQKNPSVFLSLADKPIRTPAQLVGKRLGVPSADRAIVLGFLSANNIDRNLVHFIPVEDDPAPLVAGEIDAYFGYSTDEEIDLMLRGVPLHALRFDEFGAARLFQVYSVHENSLADPAARAKLVAFLLGERLGWRDALKDPDLGATLAIRTYGSSLGLVLKQQLLQSRATNALMTSPDTQVHGLFWMSQPAIARAMEDLHREGISMSASDLFDTSILTEMNKHRGMM
jgi:ABC-type nitrate/sulfonate/bicarbonate transport system substrate-binding protein